MNDNLSETGHDIKTPVLNDPETYILTHDRFNTSMT